MTESRIGDRLKAARKAAGYKTAMAFCQKFDIPKSTYSQHESNERNIKEALLEKYAESLSLNIEWLRTGEGSPISNKNNLSAHKLDHELAENKLVNDILNRRFAIHSMDEALLAEVLSSLMSRKESSSMTSAELAHAATGLYNSLQMAVSDDKNRIEMVKVAVETYFKFFGERG